VTAPLSFDLAWRFLFLVSCKWIMHFLCMNKCIVSRARARGTTSGSKDPKSRLLCFPGWFGPNRERSDNT
jgi:hypothetical protein